MGIEVLIKRIVQLHVVLALIHSNGSRLDHGSDLLHDYEVHR